MKKITLDEAKALISNCDLGKNLKSGIKIYHHKYQGGQIDWAVDDEDGLWAWYGGDYAEKITLDELNIIAGYEIL